MTWSWIGVDLDGTLAVYDGWKGHNTIGEPVPDMVLRVTKWIQQGKKVKIFTARVSDPQNAVEATVVIQNWCERHIGYRLDVTCVKDFAMVELWDDRCVGVEMNKGRPLNVSPMGLK